VHYGSYLKQKPDFLEILSQWILPFIISCYPEMGNSNSGVDAFLLRVGVELEWLTPGVAHLCCYPLMTILTKD
jgi:hypothetical protein